MGLVTRFYGPNGKGSILTIKEMDDNLYYLQSVGVSGVTYQNNLLTLINPTGGTNTVLLNNFYTTGATYSNGKIYFNRNDELSAYTVDISSLTGDSNTFITATTYNDLTNTITLKDNANNNFNIYLNQFSGLTINGNLNVDTISATTYQNLPIDPDTYVTGGTYYEGIYDFTNNSGGTFYVSATTTYSAGVISGGTWSSAGGGQINLPKVKVALFNNSENLEPIYVYNINSGVTGIGGIPLLTNNDTNYIVIEYNNGNPKWNVLLSDALINDSDTVLYMVVYRLNNFVHTLEFGNQGAGLPNKINDRIIMTDRFARESGFSLDLSGSTGVVTLSSGVSWNGTLRQQLDSVNSQNDIFFQNFHSGGVWDFTTTGNTLNNLYYDNGTNPVLVGSNKFLVNWYFRGQEINDHLYEVWGNNEYDTLSEAQLSVEPLLPELITSHAFLVGRIIVQSSATTGSVESSFITVFQGSTVQAHNDLTAIQGGLAGEYYHLNFNQYNNLPLLNENNIFQSGITANTISASTISSLTYYGDGNNLTNVVNSITTLVGLSANTTTGNILITNTDPDQIVTISGGTGILTGGTYPNFTITNTSPDQTVVLSPGPGISTSGTYPNFTITNTSPASGVTLSSGGGSNSLVIDGSGPSLSVKGLSGGTGITLVDSANKVTITNNSPASSVTLASAGGTVSLVNDGTGPSLANKGLVAGTGVSLTDGGTQVTITNAAPDQTVVLNAGTGISTSGTYPNFTITNSSPASSVVLTSAGGTVSLVNDGTGPSLATKGLVAGTGISLTDTTTQITVVNTSPDQTVVLNAGSGISITGTYPNFTITNTSGGGSSTGSIQLALNETFVTSTGSITAGISQTFLPFLSLVEIGGGGGGTGLNRWQYVIPNGYVSGGSFRFITRRSTAGTTATVSVYVDGVLSNINGTQSINPVTLNTWETFTINLTTAATPNQTITVLVTITLGNGSTFYLRDASFNY